MANTYVQIYLHIIFHVKTTGVKIRCEDVPNLFRYISGIITGKGGKSISVGGLEDHVHILVSMPKDMTSSNLVRVIKTSSNAWLKNIDNTRYSKFAWQDGYGAFSVSASALPKVQDYIMNQEEHHKRQSFHDEYEQWLKAYAVEYEEKYAFVD